MSITQDSSTLDLTPDALTLVVVSEDYYREGDPRYTWTDRSETGRTFYATTHISRHPEEHMATIVTGPDDPRGGWGLAPYPDRVAALGITPGHHGWNVDRKYLTPVTPTSTPDPDRPLAVGDRVRIVDADGGSGGRVGDEAIVTGLEDDGDGGTRAPRDVLVRARLETGLDTGRSFSRYAYRLERVEATPSDPTRPPSADLDTEHREALPVREAYPIGTVWNHQSYGDAPFTVVGHRGEREVLMTGGSEGSGGYREANPWSRGALDTYGTYVGRADTPEESSSQARTYTQDEVDTLLAQERQEAADALERFKEHANGIAVQYAKDNDLCGNFERCMSDIGLLGREEWDESHKVTRYVTFRVEVQASPDEDTYTTRYGAAEWLADHRASTIVDKAVEVQDEDGDPLWES